MEEIKRKLEQLKSRMKGRACPICKSGNLYVDADTPSLTLYSPGSEFVDEFGFVYIPCIIATCEDCGYIMHFTIPRKLLE